MAHVPPSDLGRMWSMLGPSGWRGLRPNTIGLPHRAQTLPVGHTRRRSRCRSLPVGSRSGPGRYDIGYMGHGCWSAATMSAAVLSLVRPAIASRVPAGRLAGMPAARSTCLPCSSTMSRVTVAWVGSASPVPKVACIDVLSAIIIPIVDVRDGVIRTYAASGSDSCGYGEAPCHPLGRTVRGFGLYGHQEKES